MRTALIAAAVAAIAPMAVAEQGSIATPKDSVANYDPTMSAKEAVLANWELAAAGMRAGRVLGGKVAELAGRDVPYAALAGQAQFAQKTMVQRYNAALWVYAGGDDIAPADGGALTAAVAAATTPCEGACEEEREAIEMAFARATAELQGATVSARAALEARTDVADTVLMSEQLSMMANYLESADWARDFNLTAFGRDGEEVAARIVGTMALWRNIEPYVGLTDPALDVAINVAVTDLLRTLRRETRGAGALDPEGPALGAIREKADALAAELREAAALFAA